MEKIFQALSSATRRDILVYLSKTSLNAGEIAQKFDMAKPTISKHLEVLVNAGLIKSRKKGQYVHYSLMRDNLVKNLYNFLADFGPLDRPVKKAGKKSSIPKQYKLDI